MGRTWGLLVCVTLGWAAIAVAQQADDCSLSFAGQSRKAVKLRTTADGAAYDQVNAGHPITVTQWFKLVCSQKFNEQVPKTVDDSEASAVLPGAETKRVKVEGFLLAAKFEKNADHDLHVELGAKKAWAGDHLIVEVPPGQKYCDARKKLWALVTSDPAQLKGSQKVLKNPVKVTVDGYVFLDFSRKHAGGGRCTNKNSINWCDRNAGRGIHNPTGASSRVRGCWEVHPVLALD